VSEDHYLAKIISKCVIATLGCLANRGNLLLMAGVHKVFTGFGHIFEDKVVSACIDKIETPVLCVAELKGDTISSCHLWIWYDDVDLSSTRDACQRFNHSVLVVRKDTNLLNLFTKS